MNGAATFRRSERCGPQLSQFEQRVGNAAEDKLEELKHAGSELKASVMRFYQGLRS